ncbi:Serine/threonine-protein kinase TOR [Acorus gramineus]|uniref:Serine/threonine-protein kinase TOR n=1 Tax=Acorus gramineus TaxID=55184 RepID=A0AAV9BGQ2_ACOGR|nr:Serine/threonine-protein kinase TOR [Acorus gramineus]
MQSLQQQQQQLAALVTVALPNDGVADISSTRADFESDAGTAPPSGVSAAAADSDRLAALDSLHRTILYPPNALLVAHSSSFLSQALSQLLSDNVLSGNLVDRFISWALPLLRDVSSQNGSAELALEAVQEFLKSGDASSVERYVVPILKTCQELLEDERTPLNLLHQILGLLVLISLKFGHCFQPNFMDIVDLLLGWAFIPDLPESDRRTIMDGFLQFRKHWCSDVRFPLGLLSKFLGDMDVLLQDESLGTEQQLRRLLSLLSCFLTVLQVTASGMMELNLLDQVSEPLSGMVPRLLSCLSMVGKKFGWLKWMAECWRCLTLLAEILGEKFSGFYSVAFDILFQSVSLGKMASHLVHGVLKTNMQLLSLQKLGISASSVEKMLQFSSPLSQLRLHTNHLVVGSSAVTYVFLLRHECNEVVVQAMHSLTKELEQLKVLLGNARKGNTDSVGNLQEACDMDDELYTESELLALIKFDLGVLLGSVGVGAGENLLEQWDSADSRRERSMKLVSFIFDKFDLFEPPISGCVELQFHVLRMLHKLSEVELLTEFSMIKSSWKTSSVEIEERQNIVVDYVKESEILITDYLRKYNACVVRALRISSPLTVKLEAMEWICTFCRAVKNIKEIESISFYIEPCGHASIDVTLLFSILDAASDREFKVRSHVGSVVELLMQAWLISPENFQSVALVALEKLGDPDFAIKNAFIKVLSIIVPFTFYVSGALVDHSWNISEYDGSRPGMTTHLNWKQVLALKQLPQQFNPQQLVSILSYISQRWKVPLSSWIQRLIFSCHHREVSQTPGANGLWTDVGENFLEKVCPVNNLASVWWAIHEAARHCVTIRLRTNLGGPTQTFAALERMLLDIPHVLQLDAEHSEGNLNIGSSNARLLPMRLLLEFLEALKKNVYNAYEGSSIIPSATQQSSMFFRANKKVCEEWFSRMCEPMMHAGLALQCHTATIQYCTLRLQELRNLVTSALKDKSHAPSADNHPNLRARLAGDVLKVLQHASLAMCRNHEPDALTGLQKWAILNFSTLFSEDSQHTLSPSGSSRHFPWMTGLVFQARGQHEKAAAHFSHLLQSDEALSSMGSEGIQFTIARVIESYTMLSDWKSLEACLVELQALRAKHAGKVYSGALTAAGNEMNAIHALARFDEGDFEAAWGYLDLTPKSSSEVALDPKLSLERSELMLLRAMLQRNVKMDKLPDEIEKAKSMLEEALSVVPLDGLTEAGGYATQLHCIFAFKEGSKRIREDDSQPSSGVLSSLYQVLQSPISKIHQDCTLWLKVFRVYRTILPKSSVTLHIGLRLLSLARKQGNFMLSDRLNKYLKDNISISCDGRFSDLVSMNLQYENILLKYAEDNHEEALINLWSLTCNYMLCSANVDSDIGNILKAKACLKLSTWLQRKHQSLNWQNIHSKICEDINELKKSDTSLIGNGLHMSNNGPISDANYVLDLEEIVGLATKSSCRICPSMGKSWLSYASWCYNHARGSLSTHDSGHLSCSMSSDLLPELTPARFHLTNEEISRVKAVITKLFLHDTVVIDAGDIRQTDGSDFRLYSTGGAPVSSIVQQAINFIEAAAGASGTENANGDCPSAVLSSQLQMAIHQANPEIEICDILPSIKELIDIWWSLRQRRVTLFGHAAHGYFQFLSQYSSKLHESQLGMHHPDFMKQRSGSWTLRSILYILHILLNYGEELRETLEKGLATVPLLPWQEIVPQLFARLTSHPKQVVRKQLQAKLCPWSIVYPTLVDINAFEGEAAEELHQILSCMEKLYPKLVQDVQLMINELGKITVLWEEQWLSTLQDLRTDVIRRISLLKEEAARVAENATLSHSEKSKINAAKYSAMMAPIIVALERRLASTSREPETDHERWFQKDYGEQLKSALSIFKTPPVSAAALGDIWRPLDAVAASIATYQRKSNISLSEVAPRLALLTSSDVPVPGLEKKINTLNSTEFTKGGLQDIITISSFGEQVTILSTKTRPKKLVILGSDGQKYTYLLKGREDLRLDARIMQLLQAINSFIHSDTQTNSQSLAIRYYSVTPISGRAGLIQWVDNVMSIYSVFKAWQHRVHLAQLATTGVDSVHQTVLPVPRPSDMFYGKIIPALKEKGIRRVISRRDWPHEVKRKVLVELMKETPRHLLRQELWCASEGFKAFSLKSKSGDVVHIDYNVCFDKGRRLKIPEIVPFRLTQTIETALGMTGTEGAFRANCESFVGVLRKNKDIILMLLEVFVWDPLLEWTRGDGHDEAAIGGEEKKGMELAVSLSLFASRVQEIRVPLQEHHDLLLTTLPATETALEKFSDVLNQYEAVSSTFYHADQEMSSLLLHEKSAKSILAEASSNMEKTRATFEVQALEFAQAKAMAAEKAQDLKVWMEQHGRVLDALRSGSVPEVQACIRLSGLGEALSVTSAVLVAGVPLTVVPEPTQVQCHDLDREISQLATDLDNGLSFAIKALQEYSFALQRILPLNYIASSPVHGWAQILQLSLNNLSSDFLTLARRQAVDLFAKSQGDGVDSVKQRHEVLCFKVEKYEMEIEKIEREYAELVNSINSENEVIFKDRLLSAFTKYMHSAGISRKEDVAVAMQSAYHKHDVPRKVHGDLEERKSKVVLVLRSAANALYNEVKMKVFDLSRKSAVRIDSHENDNSHPNLGVICEFEEQVEKCVLIAGFVSEVQQLIDMDLQSISKESDIIKFSIEENWAVIFKASVHECKMLIEQMIEVVLPEIIKSVVSYNSEVMEAFGSLSQIRGSIDTALEQLVEVELEKASIMDLEQNYFANVELIKEKQLFLKEAAAKGRDNLSWEEAEELASQEEVCRAQLDKLNQTWNQKDMLISSLTKREVSLRNSLGSTERLFSTLTGIEQGGDLQTVRSKALLATLVKPFARLESLDQILPPHGSFSYHPNWSSVKVADILNSGYSFSESIWKFANLLKEHSLFIWKIGVMDLFLDSCMHDISSSVDHNLGFEQIYNILKKKLEYLLQEHVIRYLRERIAPSLLVQLARENEQHKQLSETMESVSDQAKRDAGAAKRVQLMLEEYCNAHETAMAARTAASLMKKRVNELTEALQKTILEIVQMEWMNDISLPYLHKIKIAQQRLFGDDKSSLMILNLNRSKLLENIQSAMTSISRSDECLQTCERTSVSVEGQLERAMGWACAGPNTTGTPGNATVKNSGIPSEFHDHLLRRRQLLWTTREQSFNVIKVCTTVMEFEASRDGLFRMPSEISPSRTTAEGRTWQQAYSSVLTRLDVSHHSFTRAEQELKVAQSCMEAAANGLYSATTELSHASIKAKSASDDLQATLLAMRDCACEASVALSAFSRVSKGHTALTSECGSMLEEVLAITDGLHDVSSLGKEAAALHGALMVNLSKANAVLLPLEISLAKDVAVMPDAVSRETDNEVQIPPVHGQAIHQSYCLKIGEACKLLRSLVPSLTYSVKELHTMLTKLARTASLHAGNLHKALEGLGGSQVVRSQEIDISRSGLEAEEGVGFDDGEKDVYPGSKESYIEEVGVVDQFTSQDEGWISPPSDIFSSSTESSITSETSLSENNGIHADTAAEQYLSTDDAIGVRDGSISDSLVETSNLECADAQNTQPQQTVVETTNPRGHLQILSSPGDSQTCHSDSSHMTRNRMSGTYPLGGGNEASTSDQDNGQGGSREDPPTCVTSASRVTKGKNAYALSVLRQVEMKLDGRDIDGDRPMSISEQVDHLIKQATNISTMSSLVDLWTREFARLREKARTALGGGEPSGSESQPPKAPPLGIAGLNQAMRAKPKSSSVPYSETVVSLLVECFSP